MGVAQEGVLYLCYYESAMKIVENSVFYKRSKHISIKYHYIREKLESGEVELLYVPKKAMAANQLINHVGVGMPMEEKILLGI